MAYTLTGQNFGYSNRLPAQSAQPVSSPNTTNDFLNNLGFGGVISSAKNDVSNLLNGLPSASATRTANAYFGANSGMGTGSDFLRNRGYDLYGQKAAQNQQAGLQDLNSLISSVSGPELTNQGQQQQNAQFNANLGQQGSQFNANLGQNQSQFDQNLQLQQFLAQLQAMGLGNSIVNSGKSNIL